MLSVQVRTTLNQTLNEATQHKACSFPKELVVSKKWTARIASEGCSHVPGPTVPPATKPKRRSVTLQDANNYPMPAGLPFVRVDFLPNNDEERINPANKV